MKTPVDFKAIRRKLAEAERAVQPSAELTRRLLAERARLVALAGERARAPEPEMLSTMLFSVGGERYALEVDYAREVIELTSLTPVPGVPAFVRGIFAVRGEVRSAVDLAAFFGRPGALADLTRVLLAEHRRMEVGILCEAAIELLDVHKDQLNPVRDDSLRSMARGVLSDGTIVLDGAALLSNSRMIVG